MAKHGQTDDGMQGQGKFSVMDTPMNILNEGGAAPAGDNQVPTEEFRDPLGLMPSGKGKGGSLGPKG